MVIAFLLGIILGLIVGFNIASIAYNCLIDKHIDRDRSDKK